MGPTMPPIGAVKVVPALLTFEPGAGAMSLTRLVPVVSSNGYQATMEVGGVTQQFGRVTQWSAMQSLPLPVAAVTVVKQSVAPGTAPAPPTVKVNVADAKGRIERPVKPPGVRVTLAGEVGLNPMPVMVAFLLFVRVKV